MCLFTTWEFSPLKVCTYNMRVLTFNGITGSVLSVLYCSSTPCDWGVWCCLISYFRKTVEQKGERVSALSINKLNPNCWREEESWVEAADQRPCLRLCPQDTNSSDILVVLQMMMIMRGSSKRTLMAHRLLAGNVYSIKFPQRQKE